MSAQLVVEVDKDTVIEEITALLISRKFERFFNDHLIEYSGTPINKRILSQFLTSNLSFINSLNERVLEESPIKDVEEFKIGEVVNFIGKAENYHPMTYGRLIKAERVTIKELVCDEELNTVKFKCEFFFGKDTRTAYQYKYAEVPITDIEKIEE